MRDYVYFLKNGFYKQSTTQGGGVAAPVGGQVLSEVLPYLNLKKTEAVEEEAQEVEVPNIEKMTIKEAKERLKEQNLSLEIENNDNNSRRRKWSKLYF